MHVAMSVCEEKESTASGLGYSRQDGQELLGVMTKNSDTVIRL